MKPREPRFVTIEQILRLHAYAIEDQGGDPSLRDRGLLESALAQPKQQFGGEYLHPTIPAMAAAYAFHICKNHPFIDGNKRAATAAMIKFLIDNGWSFDATADEAEPVILSLAAGNLSKEALTTWLERHCHEKPSLELRDFMAQLTLDAARDSARAVGASGSDAEASASTAEAAQAIPLIGDLVRAAADLRAQGDNLAAFGLEQSLVPLVTIYRIAEDMGYEW